MPMEARLYQPLPPARAGDQDVPRLCVNNFMAAVMDALTLRARPHMPAAEWDALVGDLHFASITRLDRESLGLGAEAYNTVPAGTPDPDCNDEIED